MADGLTALEVAQGAEVMSLPIGRLRSRLARLEGTGRGVRTLRVPRRIADDPGALARFIAEERHRTGWRGRVALIAVPAP